MRLIIDFGNTLKKVAVFDQEKILFEDYRKDLPIQALEEIRKQFPQLSRSIICSVVDYPKELDQYLESHFRHYRMGPKLKMPFNNLYAQPEKLGMDRAAGVAAATRLFPGSNCLVIDAGTCITLDIIKEGKDYLGGVISPGIGLRYRALNEFTNRLPLIESREKATLVGNTTQASIESGVLNGVVAEIDGMIYKYRENFNDLKVIMSGGDYNYFDKRLKNNIFAIPNIVLLGLNVILEFNDN